MKGNKTKALVHPISQADQLSFINAILDPAYGLLQKLEVILRSLNPIYGEARGFLTNLEAKAPSPLLNYVSWERGLQQKSLRSKLKVL